MDVWGLARWESSFVVVLACICAQIGEFMLTLSRATAPCSCVPNMHTRVDAPHRLVS
jgi:hypothetical protein